MRKKVSPSFRFSHIRPAFLTRFARLRRDTRRILCYNRTKIAKLRKVLRLPNPFETLGIDRAADCEAIHRAYRALARRWHPDRFTAGPERAWAEARMLEINSAYAECMRMAGPSCGGDTACLQDAEQLLRENQPMHARRLLMGMAGRSAQWNYLFGRALFMLNEHEKAATYLGIAARQQPDNAEYARAYQEAEERLYAGRKRAFRRIFARGG